VHELAVSPLWKRIAEVRLPTDPEAADVGANTVGGCYRLKLPDMKRAESTTISEALPLIGVYSHVVLIAAKKAPAQISHDGS
jgi:hypothetical protein